MFREFALGYGTTSCSPTNACIWAKHGNGGEHVVRICLTLVLGLATLLLPGFVAAQTTNATITGQITDSQKAVIVGARVAAVNTGTNARFEVVSNGTGSYVIPNLPPGPYRVEVERAGFKTVVET